MNDSNYDSDGLRDSSVSSSNMSASVGSLSAEERRDRVKKYWEKKKRRKS